MRLNRLIPRTDRQSRLAFALGVATLVAVSWLELLDHLSTAYIDSALVDAGVAFGLARGFNALISMAQSLTLTLGVGAGMDVSIGELLDPINDLVEDFSHVMKLALGSLALQKVLLLVVSDWVFKIVVTLAGVVTLVTLWFNSARAIMIQKVFWTLVFLRYVLVAVVLLNGAADRLFFERMTEADVSELQALPYNLEDISSGLSTADRAAYEDQVADLDSQLSELEADIRQSQGRVQQLESEIALLEEEKAAIRGDQDVIEILNPFHESEEMESLNERFALLAERLDNAEDRLETLRNDRAVLATDKELIERTLAGDSQGFLGMMSSGVSGALERVRRLGGILNPTQLLQSFEGAVTTMIRLMAIFMFQTVVLPLAFLYLVTRFFNRVWRTNFDWSARKPNRAKETNT